MRNVWICLMICFVFVARGQDSVLVFHQLAPLPNTPLTGPSCFVIDSDLFVVGGTDSDGYAYAQVWKYHVPNNSWTRMSDFPQGGISTAGAFALNHKGYVGGGISQSQVPYHTVWQYSPDSDNWMQKSNFPGRAQADAYFSYNQRGYMGFGYPGPCNDLWEYNDTLDHWTALDTLPAPGRYSSSFVLSDSFIYCLGGNYRFIYNRGCHETWRFNLNNNYWEQLQDIPGFNRTASATWAIGNSIVCGLGTYFDSAIAELHTDKYVYNTKTGIWKPIIFQGFHDSITVGFSFMIGNTGYYFGGLTQFKPDARFTNELYSFDATSLLTTGVSEIEGGKELKIYPNPISGQGQLSISSPEAGEVCFYNSLGQVVYRVAIGAGVTMVPCEELRVGGGVVYYSARMKGGTIVNGKVVVI